MTSDNSFPNASDPALEWNLRLRVVVPDPVPGYFHRPRLTEQLGSTDRPIAVVKAPGGFGKTALLTDYCRRLSARGVPAAWLRIDGDYSRAIFETHLALAFRHAGVNVPDPASDAWHSAGGHIEQLLSAVAAYAEPCAITIDNLERLADPDSTGALDALLGNTPPNLRVTLACRELPSSLGIAEPLLEGRLTLLTAAELRFTLKETAAFLDRRLDRRELDANERQFAGWSIALALQRNAGHEYTAGQIDGSHLLGNWIESRLWQRLSTDQRDFLLDAGLMDRLEPALLDEILERSDSRYMLQAMTEFDGLIQPFPGSDPEPAVLHPLLRRHCAARRIRETPERFKTIHRRAALALERRGEIVPSMRHAAEAGDADLLGRLVENAGSLQTWAYQVHFLIEEVISFLTDDVIKRWPRLALTRCYMLAFADRIPEACRLYDIVAQSSETFTRSPAGDVSDLLIDQCFVESALFTVGHRPLYSPELQSAMAHAATCAQDDSLNPTTRATLNLALSVYENHRARFDEVSARVEQVRQLIQDIRFPYLSQFADLQLGVMAMVRGQVQEAETFYVSALSTANMNYPNDPTSVVIADALLRGLQFERNRLTPATAAGMPLQDNFTRLGNTFATHVSESVILLETTQYLEGDDRALAVLAEMSEYARATKRQTLIRYLAALRVATLARAGRAVEAERAWHSAALPPDDEGCLDMQALGWREMEMFACARLRLYSALEAFETGREFALYLLRVARAHRLVRTEMRTYAILVALEWRADDKDAACAHLETFLRLYDTADYARPMVREGKVGRAALEYFLDSRPDGPYQSAIGDLLKMIAEDMDKDAGAHFTAHEMAVLKLLPDFSDKQIAAELAISHGGVRYHLRQIFAKLAVRRRRDAVRKARSMCLLPY